MAEVDAVLAAIARAPTRFPPYPRIDPELCVRHALTRRFPYAIAFIDIGSAIRVVAVAHERRRPGFWMTRTR